MKKIYYIILSIILSFYLTSCSTAELSPAIIFNNSSTEGSIIKNIKVNWNGYYLLNVTGPINSCGGGGINQNFDIRKKSDLFGLVKTQWENAKGENLRKDFFFTRQDLPSYSKKHTEVIFYFNQTDVEYYTSDNPDIKKIQKQKQGNWVYKYDEAKNKAFCINDPKERKRLEEVSKKYPVISKKTGKPIDDE